MPFISRAVLATMLPQLNLLNSFWFQKKKKIASVLPNKILIKNQDKINTDLQ